MRDRDGEGGGGGMRRGGGDREEAGPGDGDDNWRQGPRSNFDRDREAGRPARAGADDDGPRRGSTGFGGRDGDRDRDNRGGGGGFGGNRAGDDDNSNWRDRPARDNAPRGDGERPRLQLKPKSIAEQMGKKDDDQEERPRSNKPNPFGAAREEKSASKNNGDEVDDDGFATVPSTGKKAGGTRYVPPSERNQEKKEEPTSRKPAPKPAAEASEDEDSDASERSMKGNRKKVVEASAEDSKDDERKEREAARDERRRRDEEEDERREKRKQEVKSSGAAGGKYVPAHMRAEVERQKKLEEEQGAKQRKVREAEEAKKSAEKERKDALKQRSKDEKDAKSSVDKAPAKDVVAKKVKDDGPNVDQEIFDKLKFGKFDEQCGDVVSRVFMQKPEYSKKDVSHLVNEVSSLLSDKELKSTGPIRCLLEPLLRCCRGKEDKEVISAVDSFAPLFKCLIEKSETWRFKVQVLVEAQKYLFTLGLPRLSPASALIEVFFDGLYQAEIIEEQYFDWWTMSNDDTAGKTKAMFQMNDFLDWLRNAAIAGETDDEEDGEDKSEGSGEEDAEESEDDDDIEANVPKRIAVGRPMR